MAPLTARTEGLVADIFSERAAARPRRRHGHIVAFMAVLLAVGILVPWSIVRTDKSTETGAVGSMPASISSDYAWKVYYLNQTSRVSQTNGTIFAFDMADLPFTFSSVIFGDFRGDISHSSTYYGGCGILVDASGSIASVTLAEAGGRTVSSVSYIGQSMIVFSGERRSVSYPNESTSYYGTDQIALDWKNGTWSPSQGVFVSHPSNVSLESSVFCLMVFEPVGTTEIPEFGWLPAVVVCSLLLPIVIRRNGALGRSKDDCGDDLKLQSGEHFDLSHVK
jgi:hypothetical protein